MILEDVAIPTSDDIFYNLTSRLTFNQEMVKHHKERTIFTIDETEYIVIGCGYGYVIFGNISDLTGNPDEPLKELRVEISDIETLNKVKITGYCLELEKKGEK